MAKRGSKGPSRRGGNAADEELPELVPLGLRAAQTDDLTAISTITASLSMRIGSVGSNRASVLVPCLRVVMRSDDSDEYEGVDAEDLEAEPLLAHTITGENMAYMLMRLASDYAEAYQDFAAVSRGDIKPEPSRANFTRRCLERVRIHVDRCLELLSEGPQGAAAAKGDKPGNGG